MRGSISERAAPFPDNREVHGKVEWTREKHKHILACPTVLWDPEAMRV